MPYNNNPSEHLCNCVYCPTRSGSPTSSRSSDSSIYTPPTPNCFPADLANTSINGTNPTYSSWDVPVEEPNGWGSVAPQNVLRHTTASQSEDSWVDYKYYNSPQEQTNLLELSENRHPSDSEPSASTSNGTFPNPANHLSFPNEPFKNHAVERATRSHYEYNAPMSQAGFNTVPLYTHQPSMPPPNGPSVNQINRPSYYNSSFDPTVEAQTLYDTAPPHTGFAKQTLASNYPPVEQHRHVQPPIHMERYQPSQQTAQLSEPVATSLDMTGSFQGQKRKRTMEADDEKSEAMDEYFNLLQQKKVGDKKIALGPIITGTKIPCSEYVWKQETGQTTTKGPSPLKSSKGKSAARDTTGKPKKGPKNPKAAKAPETEKVTVGNGLKTSQDGERSAKRAKTNKNGPPKSSKPRTSGSTDGGRLVDATTIVETKMKRKSDFIHVPESQVDPGPKTTFFRYEPSFGANDGRTTENAPCMAGGSWM